MRQWHHRYQQQARWSAKLREYLLNKLSLLPGAPVLEVGVGTGAVLSAYAAEHPIKPFGVDIARPNLTFCKARNPAFHLAESDGHQLPFPDRAFQMAFCHYLLIWVKHPQQILEEMQRVTQPGGAVIALAEPDHEARIDFPPPLDGLGKLQTAALKQQGVDTALGRRLRALFMHSRLQDVETGLLGAQWTAGQSQPEETEWMTIRSDLSDDLSQGKLAEYYQIDQAAHQSGERVLFIPTFYAIGRVPCD